MALRLCSTEVKLSAVICSDIVRGIPELRKSYNGIEARAHTQKRQDEGTKV